MMVEINIDARVSNADWPKRTPDRMADLRKSSVKSAETENLRSVHGTDGLTQAISERAKQLNTHRDGRIYQVQGAVSQCNGAAALSIKQAVIRQIGTPDAKDIMDRWAQSSRCGMTDQFYSAVYRITQEFLKDKRIEEVILFHGMRLQSELQMDSRSIYMNVRNCEVADGVKIVLNNLSSFTPDVRQADDFARGGTPPFCAIVGMVVPADRIFSTPVTGPGCFNEQEVIILPGEYTGRAVCFNPDEGEPPQPFNHEHGTQYGNRTRRTFIDSWMFWTEKMDEQHPEIVIHPDEELVNADWPKATRDTMDFLETYKVV